MENVVTNKENRKLNNETMDNINKKTGAEKE